jgi:MFS family permease
MLGPGGLATIILAAYFGRLPVLWCFVIIAFLTAAWCAAATSFNSFMTARVLNGFFSTVAQGVSHVHSTYCWMEADIYSGRAYVHHLLP